MISSQTSRSGSAASARAMATRWRSPPESRLAWYFSTAGPRATWSSSSTTRSVAALPEAMPNSSIGRFTICSIVSRGFSDR